MFCRKATTEIMMEYPSDKSNTHFSNISLFFRETLYKNNEIHPFVTIKSLNAAFNRWQ